MSSFAIDVLACPHCGGRLRLIAALHDPSSSGKSSRIWGWPPQGRAQAQARPSPAPARPDRLVEGAVDAVVPARRGGISS